jgi:ribosomal protein S27AE
MTLKQNDTECPRCGGVLTIEQSAVEETVLTPRCGLARRSRPARLALCGRCDYATEAQTGRRRE